MRRSLWWVEGVGERRPAGVAWMYPCLGLAFVAVLIFVSGGSAAGNESATDAVKDTVNQVLGLLEDPDLKKPENEAELRKKLVEEVGKRFGFEQMALRSLGRYSRTLSQEQKKEFVEVFKEFLSKSYANRFRNYSGQQVKFLDERREGDFAEVRTKLVDKTEIPIDYRLLLDDGKWQVYDVIADGVSLVRNYRSQFQRIISTSSYQKLVEKLRSKSEQLDSVSQ